ncbi:MAG: hypothetical protein CVU56_29750 [Deltaproteobacteria bacterium HGW-Deltaproteobacteria-14]|jgi:hypothetical protein|nr:MAG: hypothetical protein CVU56_29750 [Deltaproteobacteria bacterium HGW-Deltaproteobacteria-14]
MRWLAVTTALLALAVAACTPSGGGTAGFDTSATSDTLPPPASGPPVQLAQYCDQYTQVACGAATSCRCFDSLGGDAALCEGFMGQRCQSEVTDWVATGAVNFDATRAGQCLAAMRRIVADCALDEGDIRLFVASHCEDFLTGARRAGEPCDGSDECVEPLSCRGEVCVTLPAPGQPCREGECADDAFCDTAAVCRAQVGAGGTCAGEGDACRGDLYCDTRSDTCQLYIASGQPCGHERWACDDDLYCSDDTDLCAPYPGVGQPCADGACADGHYCAASVCRRSAAVGAACDDDAACVSDNCDDGVCAAGDSDDICAAL